LTGIDTGVYAWRAQASTGAQQKNKVADKVADKESESRMLLRRSGGFRSSILLSTKIVRVSGLQMLDSK